MTAQPTSYRPVWFSTDRQLEVLVSVYQNASLAAKLAGVFAVPADAAHLRGILTPWMKMPMAMTAQGELGIGTAALSFEPVHFKAFGWLVRSPHKDLSFSLARTEVTAVEPMDFSSPVLRFFDMPLTRIRTTRAAPLDNFLLSIGGRVAVPRMRARSLELRASLLAWRAAAEEKS